MSTGQLIFYSGVGLLVLTIALGIVFWLRRPQYIPENADHDEDPSKNTRKLRSGYPTNRLTVRREPKHPIISETAVLHESTAQLGAVQGDTPPDTEVLSDAELLQAQQTEKFAVETAPLADETLPLTHGEDTIPLYDRATFPGGETEILDSSMLADGTEKHDATTPLSDS